MEPNWRWLNSGYPLAVVSTLLALGLRVSLQAEFGEQIPFLTFFFAVLVSAFWGGFGPALLATGLSALLALYFLIPPDDSLLPDGSGVWLRLALFLVLGLALAGLGRFFRQRMAQASLARARERQLRTAAAEANAKFRAFFDQGPLFAGMMSLDGRLLEANRLSLEFCGYVREQVIGKPFWDCPWWSPEPALAGQIRSACRQAAAGELFRAELPYFVSDGTRRLVAITILPIRDETGQTLFLAPTGTDITERRQLEDDLRQLATDLKAADRRKDEFLAMLAHELRNPLVPIRSGLDLLALEENADQNAAELRRLMQRQVGHLVRLVDDLLDVSRIMTGKVELRREPVELAPLVEQSVHAVGLMIREQRQQLVITLPAEPLRLHADPERLVQVLQNLLNNACKYTDAGGRIQLSADREGDQVTIRVRDSGVGIDAELLPRIFDLFTQSTRSLDRAQGGLGIGLTLVKNLVTLHGGSINARSDGPGCGSEFEVRLPWCATASRPLAAPVCRPLPRRCRVVVVEDMRASAHVISRLIAKLGDHEVTLAHDGPTALQTILDLHPDVVLLDIGLPGLDGYQVAKRVRANPAYHDVVLVALTGYGQEEDRLRSRQAGFDEHLVKPPSLAQIELALTHPRMRPASDAALDSAEG